MRVSDSQKDALIADSAKRDLHTYVCLMNDKYKSGKFSKALCYIVQEAMLGKYRNKIVIVHAPPRSGKSTIISETAAPWFTGKFPEKSVIIGSANEDLASRFSAKMREKVDSSKHLAIFGPNSALGNRARANDFNLVGGGEVRAVGMNSGVIGRGASIVIIDDPYGTLEEAQSAGYRETIYTKFVELMTRINSGDFTVIIVAQRLHRDDLSGRLMREKPNECVYFQFPAIIEDDDDANRDALKRNIGESLVPELFTTEDYLKRKDIVSTSVWRAAYKGVPPGEAGNRFKNEWLKRIDMHSDDVERMNIYLLADPAAAKKASSDYSAFFIIGCGQDKNFYILDGIRERLGLKERWEAYRDLWLKWRPLQSWYEAYGASADIEYFEQCQKTEKIIFEIKNSAYLTHSGRKRLEGESGEKDTRIEALIPQMSGNTWFAASDIMRQRDRGDGTFEKYDPVDEMKRFEMPDWPKAEHDDCLDAISRINDISVVWPINHNNKTKRIKSFASPW